MGQPHKPTRIKLSRKKGFVLQAQSRALNGLPAVNVARPSKWGNPYKASEYGAENAVGMYELEIIDENVRTELRGKNLACWCDLDKPCHADVLLKIANCEPCETRSKP